MSVNPFSEQYQSLSNTELLEIVSRAVDYQPFAVDAARQELKVRQLTAEQIQEAKRELQFKKQAKENKKHKIRAIEEKVKSTGVSALEVLNPIKKEKPTTDKSINYISIFCGLLFLIQLPGKFNFFKFMLTQNHRKWESSTVLDFSMLFILLIGAILFWRKKILGWVFVAAYFAATTCILAFTAFTELTHKSYNVSILNTIFEPISSFGIIVAFLLYGYTLWAICKKDMRTIYKVSKDGMYFTLAIAAVLTLYMM